MTTPRPPEEPGFAAPPPQHPTPPAGSRPSTPGRLPTPPPPQHGPHPGQFRPPYGQPAPPDRSYVGFPAPPPRHGSPHAVITPAPSSRPAPAAPFEPWRGQPVHHGPPPQQHGAPTGPAAPPARPPRYLRPPEQFGHLQYGPGEVGRPRTDQPSPVDASHQGTGAVRTPAAFGPRVISFLIDLVAPLTVLTLLLLLGVVLDSSVLLVALATIGCLGLFAFVLWNSCYQQGVTGQSLGRRVAGTRLVRIETGAPVGFGTALGRQICHVAVFGVGYLWPLWDAQRQTFADKIVGTLVVRVER